jgi:hypothetical protein
MATFTPSKKIYEGRLHLCGKCIAPSDTQLGFSHAERKCGRCGKKLQMLVVVQTVVRGWQKLVSGGRASSAED